MVDVNTLALGEHAFAAKAIGPGGEAAASATFTVRASKTGLLALVVAEDVDSKVRDKVLKYIDAERWEDAAAEAEAAAGKGIPAERAALIASDARALAASGLGGRVNVGRGIPRQRRGTVPAAPRQAVPGPRVPLH